MFKRFVSLLLSVVFLVGNGVLAHSTEANLWKERWKNQLVLAQLPTTNPLSLRPSFSPKQSSSVRALAERPKNKRVVFHIQDVHQNEEAQSHIAQTLSQLIQERQIDMVALEGAFENLDLESIREFPFPDSIRHVAGEMLKENKISGPVQAGLSSAQPIPPFIGIDDKSLYNANVKAVQESHHSQKATQKYLRELIQKNEEGKQTSLSPQLKDLDARILKYHRDEISLGEHLLTLKMKTQAVSPEIRKFTDALELEKNLSFEKSDFERTHLLTRLAQRLDKKASEALLATSNAFRLGRINQADFYTFLKELCESNHLSLSSFPHFSAYINYVDLSHKIQAETLLSETKKLEGSLYKKFIQTKEERDLIEESKFLALAEKLIEFSLTADEWKEFKTFVQRPWTMDHERLLPFEQFYRHAEARDTAMAKNLIGAMAQYKSNAAVLVTGGFHSKGIQQELEKHGIQTLPFTPKITKVAVGDHAIYLNSFTQEKAPLEKLFEGEKLFLAKAPFLPSDRFIFVHRVASSLLRSGKIKLQDFQRWAVKAIKGLVVLSYRDQGSTLVFEETIASHKGRTNFRVHQTAYDIVVAGFTERKDDLKKDFPDKHAWWKSREELRNNQIWLLWLSDLSFGLTVAGLGWMVSTQFGHTGLLLFPLVMKGADLITLNFTKPIWHNTINAVRHLLIDGATSSKRTYRDPPWENNAGEMKGEAEFPQVVSYQLKLANNAIQRITTLLYHTGWSRKEFFRRSGIHLTQQIRWEKGQVSKLPNKLLYRAAKALNVSPIFLLTGLSRQDAFRTRPHEKESKTPHERAAFAISTRVRLLMAEQGLEMKDIAKRLNKSADSVATGTDGSTVWDRDRIFDYARVLNAMPSEIEFGLRPDRDYQPLISPVDPPHFKKTHFKSIQRIAEELEEKIIKAWKDNKNFDSEWNDIFPSDQESLFTGFCAHLYLASEGMLERFQNEGLIDASTADVIFRNESLTQTQIDRLASKLVVAYADVEDLLNAAPQYRASSGYSKNGTQRLANPFDFLSRALTKNRILALSNTAPISISSIKRMFAYSDPEKAIEDKEKEVVDLKKEFPNVSLSVIRSAVWKLTGQNQRRLFLARAFQHAPIHSHPSSDLALREIYAEYFNDGIAFPYDEPSLAEVRDGNWGMSVRDRFVRADGSLSTFYSLSALAYVPEQSPLSENLFRTQTDFRTLPFAAKFKPTPTRAFHLTLAPIIDPRNTPFAQEEIEEAKTKTQELASTLSPFQIYVNGLTLDPNSGRIMAQVYFYPEEKPRRRTITLLTPFQPLTPEEKEQMIAWVEKHRTQPFGYLEVIRADLVHTPDSFGITKTDVFSYPLLGQQKHLSETALTRKRTIEYTQDLLARHPKFKTWAMNRSAIQKIADPDKKIERIAQLYVAPWYEFPSSLLPWFALQHNNKGTGDTVGRFVGHYVFVLFPMAIPVLFPLADITLLNFVFSVVLNIGGHYLHNKLFPKWSLTLPQILSGYVAERRSRQNQRQHQQSLIYWKEHIDRSRQMILDGAARLTDKKAVTILGVGEGNDIPLEELARQFDVVHLTDVNKEAMEIAVLSVPEGLRNKIRTHLVDLSGGTIEKMMADALEIIASEPTDPTLAIRKIKSTSGTVRLELPTELVTALKASYVVSSLVVTQLNVIPQHFVFEAFIQQYGFAPPSDLFDMSYYRGIVIQHFDLLSKLISGNGLAYVSSDMRGYGFTSALSPSEETILANELEAFLTRSEWSNKIDPEIKKAFHLAYSDVTSRHPDVIGSLIQQIVHGIDPLEVPPTTPLLTRIFASIQGRKLSYEQTAELFSEIKITSRRLGPKFTHQTIPVGLDTLIPPGMKISGRIKTWDWILSPLLRNVYEIDALIIEKTKAESEASNNTDLENLWEIWRTSTERFKPYWTPYIQRSKELILQGALHIKNRDSVIILGAGACSEIPLKELARLFQIVHLVDIDEEAMQIARAQLPEYLQAKVHIHKKDIAPSIHKQLLPRVKQILNEDHSQEETRALIISELINVAQNPKINTEFHIKGSYVISSMVDKQLMTYAIGVIKRQILEKFGSSGAFQFGLAEYDTYERLLAKGHLDLASRLLHTDGGRIYFSTGNPTPMELETGKNFQTEIRKTISNSKWLPKSSPKIRDAIQTALEQPSIGLLLKLIKFVIFESPTDVARTPFNASELEIFSRVGSDRLTLEQSIELLRDLEIRSLKIFPDSGTKISEAIPSQLEQVGPSHSWTWNQVTTTLFPLHIRAAIFRLKTNAPPILLPETRNSMLTELGKDSNGSVKVKSGVTLLFSPLALLPAFWNWLTPILTNRGWSDRKIASLAGIEDVVLMGLFVNGFYAALTSLGWDQTTKLFFSTLFGGTIYFLQHRHKIVNLMNGVFQFRTPRKRDLVTISILGLALSATFLGLFENKIVGIVATMTSHSLYDIVIAPILHQPLAMAQGKKSTKALAMLRTFTDSHPPMTLDKIFGPGIKDWFDSTTKSGNRTDLESAARQVVEDPIFWDLVRRGKNDFLLTLIQYSIKKNILFHTKSLALLLTTLKRLANKQQHAHIPSIQMSIQAYLHMRLSLQDPRVQEYLGSDFFSQQPAGEKLVLLVDKLLELGLPLEIENLKHIHSALPRQLSEKVQKKDIRKIDLPLEVFRQVRSALMDSRIQDHLESPAFLNLPKEEKLTDLVQTIITLNIPLESHHLGHIYTALPKKLSPQVDKDDIGYVNLSMKIFKQVRKALKDIRVQNYLLSDSFEQLPPEDKLPSLVEIIVSERLQLDTTNLLQIHLALPIWLTIRTSKKDVSMIMMTLEQWKAIRTELEDSETLDTVKRNIHDSGHVKTYQQLAKKWKKERNMLLSKLNWRQIRTAFPHELKKNGNGNGKPAMSGFIILPQLFLSFFIFILPWTAHSLTTQSNNTIPQPAQIHDSESRAIPQTINMLLIGKLLDNQKPQSLDLATAFNPKAGHATIVHINNDMELNDLEVILGHKKSDVIAIASPEMMNGVSEMIQSLGRHGRAAALSLSDLPLNSGSKLYSYDDVLNHPSVKNLKEIQRIRENHYLDAQLTVVSRDFVPFEASAALTKIISVLLQHGDGWIEMGLETLLHSILATKKSA